MSRIRLDNTSKPIETEANRKGLQYYDWKVYIAEAPEDLDKIDYVTYFLHPTFPDPVRTVSDPSTGFALETAGWGEFKIGAKIQFKDGSSSSTSYMLDLSKSE